MMKRNKNILLAGFLILIVTISRIVNFEMHLYNLAPVAALGLFGGAVIKDKRIAFLLPILSYFISDLYIHFFSEVSGFYGIEQLFVYGSMMLITFLGSKMKQPKALKVLGYSVTSAVLFFIVSNFGTFLSIQFGVDLLGYGKGWQGFITTYTMAIPFFKNTLVSTVLFSGLLFGTYHLASQAWGSKAVKA